MEILLIEDDVVDAQTVKRFFEAYHLPHELRVMDNAKEALDRLRSALGQSARESCPGLILLDLNMPGMNGLEFLAEVKANPALRQIPVIVLSTSDLESDVRASYQGGVAGYFVKPLEYTQFVATLESIVRYWELCQIPPEPAPLHS